MNLPPQIVLILILAPPYVALVINITTMTLKLFLNNLHLDLVHMQISFLP